MNKNIFKFFSITVVLCILLMFTSTYAISITSNDKVAVNQKITVTINIGAYIGAYDKLEVKYNTRVMTLTSDLDYGPWWDKTDESKGINSIKLTFNTIDNGTSNISVNIKGAVSANSTMDQLGNLVASKRIIVGTGRNKGDLNKDGKVNAADATKALELFKNGNATAEDLMYGDMDGRNGINANDATMILEIFKNSNI